MDLLTDTKRYNETMGVSILPAYVGYPFVFHESIASLFIPTAKYQVYSPGIPFSNALISLSLIVVLTNPPNLRSPCFSG